MQTRFSIAAQAIALHSDMLAGGLASIDSIKLPEKQGPDTAPRWARTDQTIPLWDYASSDQLQGDGTAPLNVYFRIPPDIFYADRPNAVLKLVYRYNSIPIGPISSLQVRVNNAFLGSTPLIPGQEASRKMETEVPVPVVNLRPVLQLAFLRLHFSVAEEGRLRGYDAHQHARRHPARFLPGSPRLSALCATAQPGDIRERGLPVYALCRSWRDHRRASCHAHRAGDRDLHYADGTLWPADGISRLARHRGRSRRSAPRRKNGFSDSWHR